MAGRRRNTDFEQSNKRQHILDAAYIVFSRKGFHCATIDEIIALADTGKGTVYNYFVNKEQLFYTLVQESCEPFQRRIDAIMANDEKAMEKIYSLTEEMLRFFMHHVDLWRVMMHEIRLFDRNGKSAVFNEKQQVKYRKNFDYPIEMLERALEMGIEQKAIRQCNVRQAAYGLFSAIIAMVLQELVGDDIRDTAHHIAFTFLFGIATEYRG
jgi:AcrR family transcriptional regulator